VGARDRGGRPGLSGFARRPFTLERVSRRLIALAGVVIAGFAAAALLLPHSPAGLRELLLSLGPAAPAIALCAWVLLTPALFPGTVLAAAGGLAFGAVAGAGLAIAGAVSGGLAAFVVARTAARGPVERLVRTSPRMTRANELLQRRGFATVLAARLMPGVPAGGLHYAAGVSPVPARSFALAMALGALLRTVPYAVLGQGLGTGSLLTMLFAAGSLVLGAIAAALLVRQIRRPVAAA
jgi:uncharacterized membrane protein YdjX (TVP38/TMEM64 family)